MNWTHAEYQEALARRGAPAPAAVAPPKARGRIRPPKSQNKTEAAYDAHLAMRKRLGEVLWYRFEGITLKLGDDCRLTPDFAVLLADGSLELHDTKVIHRGKKRAHVEDDALAKMRVAADMFPFTIRMVWPSPNGEWETREF